MKTTVIVSGLTRCGSSLTMQMLHAGGMPISCDQGNESISGEHATQLDALRVLSLGQADGMAIKCLDPHHFPIPPNRPYIILWCCRDFSEQAKSIAKFMGAVLGVKINRNGVKAISKSLPSETNECLKKLSKLGPIYKIRFEDTIRTPEVVANSIATAVKEVATLDVSKMPKVIIQRDPKNYIGFLEMDLIKNI